MTKPTKKIRQSRKDGPIPARSREAVLADFRKVAGPLRGRNRDQ